MKDHRLTPEEKAAAYEEGRKMYRARCREIICSSAARGRSSQALHLALNTDMDAADAIKHLAQMTVDPNDPINPVPKPGSGGVFSEPSAKDVTEAAIDAAWARTIGALN